MGHVVDVTRVRGLFGTGAEVASTMGAFRCLAKWLRVLDEVGPTTGEPLPGCQT
jgi:hypothetical protein